MRDRFAIVAPTKLNGRPVGMGHLLAVGEQRDELEERSETAKAGVSLSDRLEFRHIVDGGSPTPSQMWICTVW